jgi:hypothetical protein
MQEKPSRGRQAQPSAEKPDKKPDKKPGVYEMLHDDKYYMTHPRRGGAVGTEMKKDLSKMLGIVRDV